MKNSSHTIGELYAMLVVKHSGGFFATTPRTRALRARPAPRNHRGRAHRGHLPRPPPTAERESGIRPLGSSSSRRPLFRGPGAVAIHRDLDLWVGAEEAATLKEAVVDLALPARVVPPRRAAAPGVPPARPVIIPLHGE